MGQLVASGDTVAAGVMGVIQDRMVNMLDAFARQHGVTGPRLRAAAPLMQQSQRQQPRQQQQQQQRGPPANTRKRPASSDAKAPGSGKKPNTAVKVSSKLSLEMPKTVDSKVWLLGDSQVKRIQPKWLRSCARATALGGHSIFAAMKKLETVVIDAAVETIVIVLGTIDVVTNQYASFPGRLADVVALLRGQLAYQGQLLVCNLPVLTKYRNSIRSSNEGIADELADLDCSVVDFAGLMLSGSGDPFKAQPEFLEKDGKHVTELAMQKLMGRVAGMGVPITMVGYRKPKNTQRPPADAANKSPLLDADAQGKDSYEGDMDQDKDDAALDDDPSSSQDKPGADKHTMTTRKGKGGANK